MGGRGRGLTARDLAVDDGCSLAGVEASGRKGSSRGTASRAAAAGRQGLARACGGNGRQASASEVTGR